jgi:hypothetical protein
MIIPFFPSPDPDPQHWREEWSYKMEVRRASGHKHCLIGPTGAIGSSSKSKQVNKWIPDPQHCTLLKETEDPVPGNGVSLGRLRVSPRSFGRTAAARGPAPAPPYEFAVLSIIWLLTTARTKKQNVLGIYFNGKFFYYDVSSISMKT